MIWRPAQVAGKAPHIWFGMLRGDGCFSECNSPAGQILVRSRAGCLVLSSEAMHNANAAMYWKPFTSIGDI